MVALDCHSSFSSSYVCCSFFFPWEEAPCGVSLGATCYSIFFFRQESSFFSSKRAFFLWRGQSPPCPVFEGSLLPPDREFRGPPSDADGILLSKISFTPLFFAGAKSRTTSRPPQKKRAASRSRKSAFLFPTSSSFEPPFLQTHPLFRLEIIPTPYPPPPPSDRKVFSLSPRHSLFRAKGHVPFSPVSGIFPFFLMKAMDLEISIPFLSPLGWTLENFSSPQESSIVSPWAQHGVYERRLDLINNLSPPSPSFAPHSQD